MRLLTIGLSSTAWFAAALFAGPLSAQHDHAESPYAGEQTSEIPSLTLQQLEGLRRGEGMGLAKPAELNHYPGPKHVLELADDLHLSQEQRTQIEEIRSTMAGGAIRIGAQIIQAEATLNRRFSHGHIDETTLEDLVTQIAGLYGKLRFVHLAAHLSTRAILTTDQVATYDRLRGYTSGPTDRSGPVP